MTPKKKKKRARATVPERARDHAPRGLRGGGERRLGYPSAREWIAATAIALVSSGCAEPVCSSSRMDELTSHARIATEQLSDLELRAAFENLGIATGIAPHPAPMPLAGAMIAPLPLLPTPPGEEEPELLSGTDEKD